MKRGGLAGLLNQRHCEHPKEMRRRRPFPWGQMTNGNGQQLITKNRRVSRGQGVKRVRGATRVFNPEREVASVRRKPTGKEGVPVNRQREELTG